MSSLFNVAYAAISAEAFGNSLSPIINHIVNPVLVLVFAVALIVFVYGILQVIWGEPGGEAHERGKKSMWGGVIGMFIMFSAWGIINLVANTIKGI